jgi:hypothetical protein
MMLVTGTGLAHHVPGFVMAASLDEMKSTASRCPVHRGLHAQGLCLLLAILQ